MRGGEEKSGLTGQFQESAKDQPRSRKAKPTAPFSLRLTVQERAFLDQKAGGRPLGAYIRMRLLGERADKRQIIRKPKVDHKQLALLLSMLGQSRIPNNLNQLAKAVNSGTLELSPETEQDIIKACAAVIAMRNLLLSALGLKGEDGR